MDFARLGDTVHVHYTGRLDDDTVFDSSTDAAPLSFEIGSGQVIQGFEEALVGMSPGETKTVTIAAENAYGSYSDDQVIDVDRSMFPPDLNPEVGQQLQVEQAPGEAVVVFVTDVGEETVRLDANHPLAGQDLTFDLTLVSVER